MRRAVQQVKQSRAPPTVPLLSRSAERCNRKTSACLPTHSGRELSQIPSWRASERMQYATDGMGWTNQHHRRQYARRHESTLRIASQIVDIVRACKKEVRRVCACCGDRNVNGAIPHHKTIKSSPSDSPFAIRFVPFGVVWCGGEGCFWYTLSLGSAGPGCPKRRDFLYEAVRQQYAYGGVIIQLLCVLCDVVALLCVDFMVAR